MNIMVKKTESENVLTRLDERVGAVHEYIVNEIRPALKEIVSLKETMWWLKAGVLGIYGLFGSTIISGIAYLIKH